MIRMTYRRAVRLSPFRVLTAVVAAIVLAGIGTAVLVVAAAAVCAAALIRLFAGPRIKARQVADDPDTLDGIVVASTHIRPQLP